MKCDSSQHNLNILFDPPTPERWSHNALRAPARLETLSGGTVDHSSQEMTSRSHEDSAMEMRLIILSPVARGREKEKRRSKGEKMEKNPKHFTFYSFRLQITYSANCKAKSSPPPPDSPTNGVVFKTFITNSLLLIFQQQGLKLCLLSN